MKAQFDDEELDIIQKYKDNKLKVSKTRKKDIDIALKSAKVTIQPIIELRIKLTEKDLRNLQLKEIETGMSYQNIISALVHKYLDNKIGLTI